MDLGTAIGVASLVMEGCRTAMELYGRFRDQREHVQKLADVELEQHLNELKVYASRLSSPPGLPSGRNTLYLKQCEQALADLSLTTSESINTLLSVMHNLQPKQGQTRLDCWVKACKSMKYGSKLGKLKDQFSAYQQRISVLLLACLNEKSDLTMELVTRVLDNQDKHMDAIGQVKEVISVLSVNHNTYKGLVLGLKDGSATTIRANIPPTEGKPSSTLSTFQAVSTGPTTQNFQRIIDVITQCLRFSNFSERRNSIAKAHFSTFDWIFTQKAAATCTEAFSSFPQWLETGQGCYWIQGKAGSGKSTLMKKILESSETRQHLEVWCGGRELSMPCFFFWYIDGSGMLRSKEGMLRSLLSTLLEEMPQIVLSAFPELLIQASALAEGCSLAPPSFDQLQEWLREVIKACHVSDMARICFFIDGLDEHSGDKNELAEFLLDLSQQSCAVKFVLASRPLSVFAAQFSKLPGLRVQDLTRSDIRDYIQSLFNKANTTFEHEELESMMKTIAARSQGVFLWVVVVVKSVLEGLRDGDTMPELLQRVKGLPTELSDLYQRMLNDVGPRYKPQAAEMLLLAATAFDSTSPELDVGAIEPLCAVQFCFALNGCAKAMQASIETLSNEDTEAMVRELKPRLRSRCLGLIEIRDRTEDISNMIGPRAASQDKRLLAMVVEPFHRTAVEFLLDERVCKLLKKSAGSSFDPFQNLFCSTIRMAKISPGFFPETTGGKQTELPPWYFLLEVFFLAVDARRRGGGIGIQQEYLDEFDRVLSVHWARWAKVFAPTECKDSEWFSLVMLDRTTAQGNWIPQDPVNYDLIPRVLDNGLCTQVLQSYRQVGYVRLLALMLRPDELVILLPESGLSQEHSTLLLRLFVKAEVEYRRSLGFCFRWDWVSSLDAILSAGADPNAWDGEGSKRTIWVRFLEYLWEFMSTKGGIADSNNGGQVLESMVKSFVNHGADLSATIRVKDVHYTPSIYMRTLHRSILAQLAKEGSIPEPGENTFDRKLATLVHGVGAAADFLEEREVAWWAALEKRRKSALWLRHLGRSVLERGGLLKTGWQSKG